jgi:hypothetical protein
VRGHVVKCGGQVVNEMGSLGGSSDRMSAVEVNERVANRALETGDPERREENDDGGDKVECDVTLSHTAWRSSWSSCCGLGGCIIVVTVVVVSHQVVIVGDVTVSTLKRNLDQVLSLQ